MANRIITREQVAQKLNEWASGHIASEEILEWAKGIYAFSDMDYADREYDDDENSVTNEVLADLDMLDMNLVLPEHAPIYLEFLTTPPGQFQAGYSKFQQRLDAIDYETRRRQLRHVPTYAAFLQNGKK